MYQTTKSKPQNRERILECIYRNPSISRTGIATLTGITPATTTLIVTELLNENIIYESGLEESESSSGRKRIALNIRPNYGYVIGLEFNLKALTVCLTTLTGKTIYTRTTPYDPSMNETITDSIIEHIQLAIAQSTIDESHFLGIGIAIPGHLHKNGISMVSNSNHWKHFNADKIRAAFSIPVYFENNVRCMALSSYLFHPENTPKSFALFHVGLGMFCANITQGRLFIGHTHVSGEIGHTIVNPTGLRCECGKQGCLQTVASERWILESVRQLYLLDTSEILRHLVSSAEEITLKTIASAYMLGDEAVIAILSNALKYLGISISNIAILMNPEKIFLHGELFSYAPIHSELLNIINHQLAFVENDYVKSIDILSYSKDDGAIGGAALAITKNLLNIQ